MNRKQRRKLSKRAPAKKRKEIQRELKRRGLERYSEPCMFERHNMCAVPGCGCPHHTSKVEDGSGKVVENVEIRDSGLYVATPRLRIPGQT